MVRSIILNTLPIVLLVSFASSYAQEQLFENDSYIFLHIDTEIDEMRIRNDTLYKYHCTETMPCPDGRLEAIAAIRIIRNKDDLFLLEAERSDHSGNKNDDASRSITAFKKLDANRIQQLRSFNTDSSGRIAANEFLNNYSRDPQIFAFTFYKLSYLDSIAKTAKAISTVDNVNEIMEAMRSQHYKKIFDNYSEGVKNGTIKDMYASGSAAEMLSKVCIDLGYNPVRAGEKCNELMRKQERQESIAEPKPQVVAAIPPPQHNSTTLQQGKQQQVPQDLDGLAGSPQKTITLSRKINDPILYTYPATEIAAAYWDDFSKSSDQWLDRAKDPVIENKEVIFEKNYLQLNPKDSGITLGRASGFDFSRNFEYEIRFVQLQEKKNKTQYLYRFRQHRSRPWIEYIHW